MPNGQDPIRARPNGTVVALAPPGRPPNDAERKVITEAESTRLSLLSKALPRVSELLTAITTGDPAVTLDTRGATSAREPGLEVTKRAARSHLGIFPNTYDWLNDPADKTAYTTIQVAARLMSENLARRILDKWVDPSQGASTDVCGPHQMARNEGTRVVFQADWFTSAAPPMPSTMCPGIILLHEYFHWLVVNPEDPPPKQGIVCHGQPWPGQATFSDQALYSLHDAYSLTSFTVEVALGYPVECVCQKA